MSAIVPSYTKSELIDKLGEQSLTFHSYRGTKSIVTLGAVTCLSATFLAVLVGSIFAAVTMGTPNILAGYKIMAILSGPFIAAGLVAIAVGGVKVAIIKFKKLKQSELREILTKEQDHFKKKLTKTSQNIDEVSLEVYLTPLPEVKKEEKFGTELAIIQSILTGLPHEE